MKYLFAFGHTYVCENVRRGLEEEGIVCEIHKARQFPDGTQGPELWIRDEDFEKAKELFEGMQREA